MSLSTCVRSRWLEQSHVTKCFAFFFLVLINLSRREHEEHGLSDGGAFLSTSACASSWHTFIYTSFIYIHHSCTLYIYFNLFYMFTYRYSVLNPHLFAALSAAPSSCSRSSSSVLRRASSTRSWLAFTLVSTSSVNSSNFKYYIVSYYIISYHIMLFILYCIVLYCTIVLYCII